MVYYDNLKVDGYINITTKDVNKVNKFLNGFRKFDEDKGVDSYNIEIARTFTDKDFSVDKLTLTIFVIFVSGLNTPAILSQDIITQQDLLDILDIDPFRGLKNYNRGI